MKRATSSPSVISKHKKTSGQKKSPILKTALRVEALALALQGLDIRQLNEVASTIRKHLHWSIGDPTETRLREIENASDVLRQLIDFDIVVHRLEKLHEFDRSTFGVSLVQFIPELNTVYDSVKEAIFAYPIQSNVENEFDAPAI